MPAPETIEGITCNKQKDVLNSYLIKVHKPVKAENSHEENIEVDRSKEHRLQFNLFPVLSRFLAGNVWLFLFYPPKSLRT